ncbi:hypothetical protein GTO91_00155 [Heliobacterium undosum]|uniref:Uncharacterized protein n=1 Tax=Heliomicrobium undosum TaxID=121734 RepID=A0A845KYP7_9FIRM|nr:hypothetical protein [Heliomicrobium undosum]MZP28136.1 hypothetical protein [Heliomicrobium undosum]
MLDRSFNRRTFLGLAVACGAGLAAYGLRRRLSIEPALAKNEIPEDPMAEPLPINQPGYWVDLSGFRLSRRKFPYPYKAAVTITSDIDGSTLDEFGAIHEYLNSRAMTAMGQGLGLDIADSFWMYNATDVAAKVHPDGRDLTAQMTYWKGTSATPYCAEAISHYLRCGWIDSIHSYGDFTRTDPADVRFARSLAEAAAKEWRRTGMDKRFEIWIDHGNSANVQNFGGADRDGLHYQAGDDPASPYYHTDLLPNIRFVWGSTRGSFESRLCRPSLLYRRTLRDGKRLWGFYRYTNEGLDGKNSPRWIWSPHLLKEQLNPENFRQLKESGGYAAFAQHLGGPSNLNPPFRPLEYEPLQLLAREQEQGEILVARTSRLLRYNLADLFVRWSAARDAAGNVTIDISAIDDPHRGSYIPTVDDIRGITFSCSDPFLAVISLNGTPLEPALVRRHRSDRTGFGAIGVAWHNADKTNYRIDDRRR